MTHGAGLHEAASAAQDTTMKLKITKPFAFAHRGCDVVQYTAGQEVDTEDQELIDTALTEKWATKAREARQTKVLPGAPENKGAEGDEAGDSNDQTTAGDQAGASENVASGGDTPSVDVPQA